MLRSWPYLAFVFGKSLDEADSATYADGSGETAVRRALQSARRRTAS